MRIRDWSSDGCSSDRGLDAWNRIQSSADPQLRLVTIPKSTAAIPAADFAEPVAWAAAGPKTVGAFSAACSYMAQGLRRDLGIPISATASDWGWSHATYCLSPCSAPRVDLKSLLEGKSVAGLFAFGVRRCLKQKKTIIDKMDR